MLNLKKLVELGLSKGADEVEIYHEQIKKTQIKIYKSEVESLLSSVGQGIAARVFTAGKMGFSYSTNLSDQGLKQLIMEAIESARLIDKSGDQQLPNPADSYPEVHIYNPDIVNTDIQEKIKLALLIEKTAYEYDSLITNVPAVAYADEEAEVRLVNSKGLDQSYKNGIVSASIHVIASKDGVNQTGLGIGYGRHITDLDPVHIARKGAEEALQLLGGKPIESQNVLVLFNSHTGSDIFSAFVPGFLGENVQKNKSMFKGKLNTQIANPLVTLIDDGLREDGLRAAPFDDEGVPSQRTIVVEQGVLKSYLYDTNSARVDNLCSTGNAHRRSLKDYVEVAPTNFYLEEGEHSLDEMIAGIEEGFLVMGLSGVHSGTNAISGDFSVGASGVWIKHGKLAQPVKEVTVAGNFSDLLQDIIQIGNDLEFNVGTGFMGTPSFVVRELVVSGK